MLSPITIVVLSTALINPAPKIQSHPIYFSGNYTIEAAEYLRKQQQNSNTTNDINDIMYREILKELKSKDQD